MLSLHLNVAIKVEWQDLIGETAMNKIKALAVAGVVSLMSICGALAQDGNNSTGMGSAQQHDAPSSSGASGGR